MHKLNAEEEKKEQLAVVSWQLWWSTERKRARLLGRGRTSSTGANDTVRNEKQKQAFFWMQITVRA